MPALSPSWTTKTVTITYRNPLTLNKEAGSWIVETTGRVTNTLSDGKKQVFRPGKISQGNLNILEDGNPSITVDVPIVDDPDNSPQGGSVRLSVTFASGGSEVFTLYPLASWSAVTDIGNLLDPTITPGVATYQIKGVPGGVAALNADGNVIDAFGNVITSGGGGGGSLTVESFQDTFSAAVTAGNNIQILYDDAANALTLSVIGILPIARMAPGTSYKLLWDDTNKVWQYNNGTTLVTTSARLNNRTDIYIDFIGGRESDRPSWGNQDGDTQMVTQT